MKGSKDMKKLISLAAAVVMLVTSAFSGTVFAAYTDVAEDNRYSKAITTLSKLGVINGYEDGTFKPDGSITRAEFTKIVTYTLGLSELKTEPKEFSDISEHWARYNIKTAYDQGIINGFEDGTFRPDENVTYEQALKMVVCTLGYGSFAEAAGGYPQGYQTQAAALDLTKSITGLGYDQPASRGAIAQVVYNALEVETKKLDGTTWVSSGKNLLNDYLGVKKFKGEMAGVEDYVTGNCHGALLKGQMQMVNVNDTSDYITMDYTEYTSNITDVSKLLGKMITVYYRQKNEADDAYLVIIDDETTKNTEYVIKSDDLDSFSSSAIKYFEEGTNASKSVKFDLDKVTVRYNGKTVSKSGTKLRNKSYTSKDNEFTSEYSFENALSAWLSPSSANFIYGDVILTDRESDGTVDDIQINDYQTMVALKTPSTSDYKITDKLKTGNSLILNPDSTVYTYTIVKDGKQIPVTSIAANDVILYAESIDKDLYTVYASNAKITGTITSVNEADNSITIDNKEYKLGESCADYVKTKQGETLSSGQSVTFYVDKYNTLVYGEVAAAKENPYAYITNAYQEDGSESYYIMAFCPSKTSSVASYKLKNKVSVNGVSISASKAVEELAKTAAYSNSDIDKQKEVYKSASKYNKEDSAYKYSQLARLEFGSDGNITGIITMESADIESTNESKSKIALGKELAEYSYTSSSFTLKSQTQFSINSSTLIIYVPGNRAKADFAKKTSGSTFTSTDKYYVEAYDISASKYAGVVLLYGSSGSSTEVSKTTDFSIVAKTPSVYYDTNSDENRQQLTVFAGTSNAEKDWVTQDNDTFSDSEVGDVIQFAFDQDRYIFDRVNCIKFTDIAEVLDGKTTGGAKYNWNEEQEPSEDNNMQSYKFDYRFKKAGTSNDETYASSTLGTVPYSRASMFNVMQVLDDDNKIYVTKNGFDADGNLLNEDDYEEYAISSTTKFIRMESNRKSFSPYAEETETDFTFKDLKDAKNYGADCSKVLITSLRGVARLVVVYN